MDLFEQKFKEKFGVDKESISVNSGTSALHLAYELCDIRDGDEVIVSLFTPEQLIYHFYIKMLN